jgi:hypothetical protein
MYGFPVLSFDLCFAIYRRYVYTNILFNQSNNYWARARALPFDFGGVKGRRLSRRRHISLILDTYRLIANKNREQDVPRNFYSCIFKINLHLFFLIVSTQALVTSRKRDAVLALPLEND